MANNEIINIEQIIREESKNNPTLAKALRLYYDALMQPGRSSNFPRIPNDPRTTALRMYLEEHVGAAERIANAVFIKNYGQKTFDFVSLPQNYRAADLPTGFPHQKKNTPNVFPISNESLRIRTQRKTPLVPLYREDNIIRLLGYDNKTNRNCLYSIVINYNNENSDQSTPKVTKNSTVNVKLVIYMGGQEYGLTNIERPTFNPSNAHANLLRDNNGVISTTNNIADQFSVYPEASGVHGYSYLDKLFNVHGYSSNIDIIDDGFGKIITGSQRFVVTTPRLRQSATAHSFKTMGSSFIAPELRSFESFMRDFPSYLRTYQFSDMLEAFCQRNNIMHAPISQFQIGLPANQIVDLFFPEESFLFQSKEDLMAFYPNQDISSPNIYGEIKKFYEDGICYAKTALAGQTPLPDELIIGTNVSKDEVDKYIHSGLYVNVSETETRIIPSNVGKDQYVSSNGNISQKNSSQDPPEQI